MQTILPKIPKQIFEEIVNFKEVMMMYHSAIREVTTKLEILNDELSLDNEKNPIQLIKSRIKEPISIANKLIRLDKKFSVGSIMSNLDDVAVIRVIYSFIDNVYKIAYMLVKQDDIVLIRVKFYIENPKSNGYRSYHMIIEVPVFFSQKNKWLEQKYKLLQLQWTFGKS